MSTYACTNVGFFYGARLAIATQNLCRRLFLTASPRRLSLPSSPNQKSTMQLENKKTPNFKGYSPLLTQGDRSGDGVMAGANVWPDKPPRFREAALQYYHSAVRLGKAMFPLFALALHLDEDFFDDKTVHSAALMKVLHYPPQTGPCFTILWQEPDIQALQVLNSDNKWINAPPVLHSQKITKVLFFKSNVHRAVNRSGVRRYSLFFGTDYDVKLEPIPGCVSDTRPMQYEVVTAGNYVPSKLKQTYNHS
ncbi:Clavaminate synthase-like protein [Hymenopellis radicata]|nr:Clavaminate synthase-like protein [Hymenopellis radicata]